MKEELTTIKNLGKEFSQGLVLKADVFSTPTARESSRLELDKIVIPALVKAVEDLGYNPKDEKLKHLYASVSEGIKSAVPNIRLAEIPLAIQKGVLGDFGEFHGLSVVSVVKFVKIHYTGRERSDLVKQVAKTKSEKKEPSESEVRQGDIKLLTNAFQEYKSKGFYEDHGNYLYKVAVKKFNLFELSEEAQKMLLERGKKIAYDKIKLEIYKCGKYERNKLLNEAQDLIDLVAHSDGVKRVYKEALQLALNDWFGNLIEMEVNLPELFN